MDLRSKKLRFSRMFRPSFAASCTSRTIAQVVHRSVLIHRPSSLPDSSRTIFGDSGVVPLSFPNGSRFPRRTLSERYPPSVLRDDDYLGRRCPPSTPITPFIRRLPQPPVPTEKTKTKKQATVATEEEEEEEKEKCPYSSSTTSQEDWFSNESDACLSTSRSLSSDSSETRCRRCRRRRGGAAGAGASAGGQGDQGQLRGGEAVERPTGGLPAVDGGDDNGEGDVRRGGAAEAAGVLPGAELAPPPPGDPAGVHRDLGGAVLEPAV
ncbi:Transcription repressor (Ovate family protein), partial [Psidium guajava]